jgi:hypothetical protein
MRDLKNKVNGYLAQILLGNTATSPSLTDGELSFTSG